MKRLIQIFALVLCLLVPLLILPGCGETPDDPDNGGETAKLGNLTIYCCFGWETDYEKINTFDDTTCWGRACKWYEETHGDIEIIHVPYASYGETLTQMVASDSAPDMVQVYGGDMPGWTLNILQPVDDYFDSSKLPHQKIVESYRFQGKNYALRIESVQTYFIWYNKDLMSQFGIEEMPYDMWKNGTWTWESFHELAKQLTVDTDANGENDIWGFSSQDPQAFFYCNSAPLIDNSTYKVIWDSQACINAFEFSRDLYTDKIWSRKDIGVSGGFENGQVAMVHGSYEYGYARSVGMDVASMGVVPYPTGPDFDGSYVAYTNLQAMPKTAKNPKGAAAFAEYLAAEENEHAPLGLDPNDVALQILDEQQMEVIEYATSKAVVYPERGWGDFVSVFMECYGDIYYEGVNTKTAVDSYKPKAQAAIDDILSQIKE